jgi:hypothetical protein
MTEDLIPQQQIRIAIRFNTTNVPGKLLDRPSRIANDFATWKLSRGFSYDYDFIHLHPDVYLTTAQPAWVLCGFNVRGRVPQVDAVPIQW